MFALAVDLDQHSCQVPHRIDRDWLIVYEHPGLAAGVHFPAQDDFRVARAVEPGLPGRPRGSDVGVKDRGHGGTLFTGPNHLRRRPTAERQAKRVNKYGFAGARFPGQQVEAGPEFERQAVNDGVVLNLERAEHGPKRPTLYHSPQEPRNMVIGQDRERETGASRQ